MNYLKLGAYGLAALLLFGAGWMTQGWRADAKYAALQASDAAARADGEAAVRKQLQAQLDTLKTTSANNAQVIHALQTQNDAIAADRDHTMDLVHRLLNTATTSAPTPVVSKTGSGQDLAVPSGTSSDGPVGDLLASASDECKRNRARLDALIAQIGPQL